MGSGKRCASGLMTGVSQGNRVTSPGQPILASAALNSMLQPSFRAKSAHPQQGQAVSNPKLQGRQTHVAEQELEQARDGADPQQASPLRPAIAMNHAPVGGSRQAQVLHRQASQEWRDPRFSENSVAAASMSFSASSLFLLPSFACVCRSTLQQHSPVSNSALMPSSTHAYCHTSLNCQHAALTTIHTYSRVVYSIMPSLWAHPKATDPTTSIVILPAGVPCTSQLL